MGAFFHRVLKGLLWMAVSVGAFLSVFTVISLRMDDPAKMIPWFANIALYVGAFIGGRSTRSKGEETSALIGLATALAAMGLVLVLSLIFASWGAQSLLRAALTVLAVLLGAWVSGIRGQSRGAKSAKKRRREIGRRYGQV